MVERQSVPVMELGRIKKKNRQTRALSGSRRPRPTKRRNDFKIGDRPVFGVQYSRSGLHRYGQHVPTAAHDHPFHRGDVAIVTPPGDGDVTFTGNPVGGGIQVHPAPIRDEQGDPGMRSVPTDQRWFSRRRRFQIVAHIAGCVLHPFENGDHAVGPVLVVARFGRDLLWMAWWVSPLAR